LTLQDYINLTQDSINAFFSALGPAFANILAAVVIFIIGLLVGAILKRVWVEIMRAINLEKSLSGWGTYQALQKRHDGLDVTTFFGELLRWLAIIVFALPAVAALEIVGADQVLNRLLGYLPNVVLGSLFLILGFVISWFVHRIVMAVGTIVNNNPSHLIADIAALAVIFFASVEALLQLGLSAELVRLLIIATFAALALAFGLAGKDTAASLIKRFVDQASK
jgi:hypothetical protein